MLHEIYTSNDTAIASYSYEEVDKIVIYSLISYIWLVEWSHLINLEWRQRPLVENIFVNTE